MRIPFLQPSPPKLSELREGLAEIEQNGIYSNYGPVNARFEAQLLEQFFNGVGGCLTVCNATIGLMLCVKEAQLSRPVCGRGRYALMPSFSFAATAHAALWCGLTPLFCDIDPQTWLPCAKDEDRLLKEYGDEIAVVMPYATFGNNLDLDRYARLSAATNVPVVVDAAASLGSLEEPGKGFGTGFPFSVVFSMHVTKAFSTLEGGIIYSADTAKLDRLRSMGNFGFVEPRNAGLPGLNSKLSEVGALLGLAKLAEFESVILARGSCAELYRELLQPMGFQRQLGARVAHQFMPCLLPPGSTATDRDRVITYLARDGIGAAKYFSPHMAQQDYFAKFAANSNLSTTQMISDRCISLPLSDKMGSNAVRYVSDCLVSAMRLLETA